MKGLSLNGIMNKVAKGDLATIAMIVIAFIIAKKVFGGQPQGAAFVGGSATVGPKQNAMFVSGSASASNDPSVGAPSVPYKAPTSEFDEFTQTSYQL